MQILVLLSLLSHYHPHVAKIRWNWKVALAIVINLYEASSRLWVFGKHFLYWFRGQVWHLCSENNCSSEVMYRHLYRTFIGYVYLSRAVSALPIGVQYLEKISKCTTADTNTSYIPLKRIYGAVASDSTTVESHWDIHSYSIWIPFFILRRAKLHSSDFCDTSEYNDTREVTFFGESEVKIEKVSSLLW